MIQNTGNLVMSFALVGFPVLALATGVLAPEPVQAADQETAGPRGPAGGTTPGPANPAPHGDAAPTSFRKGTPSPEWKTETVDARDNAGVYKSLAFDGSGRPAIAYSSDTAARLATWNGSDWNLEAIDTESEGRLISLAFDPSSGAPCVSD